MMFAWIPLFPLVGVLINGLVGIKYLSRRAVAAVAVGAAGLSFAAAVASFARLVGGGPPATVLTFGTWIPASLVRILGGRLGPFAVEFAFRYDSLAAVMTLVVTGVGLLIHIYSVGYMAKDKSIARFFAYLNLFTFAMLILVLGANLAVMFIGWEGVGLCSYLLIGFWFSKDSAANAGKKAFITNRVGDFGFLLGMAILVSALGTLDIGRISAAIEGGALAKTTATAAALLLFLGATGKSAQIPLYTWLPDAMEGPTPVSALIHAATMVTAGVYMVARMHVLYTFSGTALTVVGVVGGVTAVYAATMALVQHDIKRVLAYSTISQIGYMFVGLGVGAYAAGIALAGIWAAYVVYVKKEGRPAQHIVERFGALYRLVSRKYFVDEFYNRAVVGGTLALGRLSAWFDARVVDGLVDGSAGFVRGASGLSIRFDERVVDGAVNGVGRVHLLVSRGLRRLQSGSLNTYALAIVIGLVLLVSAIVAVF